MDRSNISVLSKEYTLERQPGCKRLPLTDSMLTFLQLGYASVWRRRLCGCFIKMSLHKRTYVQNHSVGTGADVILSEELHKGSLAA